MEPPLVITEADAAALLGITRSALENRRLRHGDTPPHFKIGRLVRYRRAAVIEWIIQQEQQQRKEAA